MWCVLMILLRMVAMLFKASLVGVISLPFGSLGILRVRAEIDRFVGMLTNPSSIIKSCSAFALSQLTMPGGPHAMYHSGLLQNAGALRVLHAAAASTAPIQAKIFAKIVLRNLELHHEIST